MPRQFGQRTRHFNPHLLRQEYQKKNSGGQPLVKIAPKQEMYGQSDEGNNNDIGQHSIPLCGLCANRLRAAISLMNCLLT
jgi:hypothetical protein